MNKSKMALVLEDDKDLSRGIAFTFKKEGYQVEQAFCISEARNALKLQKFDFFIMDLNLPDGDGLELCKEIRESMDLPMIILTARDLEIDEVVGLESGADDYITKPFSLSVLKARVAAVLRRKGKKEEENVITSNGIQIDKRAMKVTKQGVEVDCSVTEYKILKLFIENKNQVLLKEQILANVWDQDGNFVDENTLPVNIRRLRLKLEENPSHPQYIRTVHGIGYIWAEV